MNNTIRIPCAATAAREIKIRLVNRRCMVESSGTG